MTAHLSGPIRFIGGGNMARALVGGLHAEGLDGQTLQVVEPDAQARTALVDAYGVVAAAPGEPLAPAGVWVLAVKPQAMREVCLALTDEAAATQPVVVSIAAGITTAQLSRWLGGYPHVVRAMPNTPALLGAGITGLYAPAAVNAVARARAEAVLFAAGPTTWVSDETLMDVVTAVSGSGPAYAFLLAEAMADAGVAQGLPREVAQQLAAHTLAGAGRMLVESGETPATLRERVTSPGGTTQAAIECFETGNFRKLVADAVAAAARRGAELSAAND